MLDLVASLHPLCREIALGRIVGVLVVCAKEKREEGMVRNYIYVAVAVVGFALYDRIAAYVTFENYWREVIDTPVALSYADEPCTLGTKKTNRAVGGKLGAGNDDKLKTRCVCP